VAPLQWYVISYPEVPEYVTVIEDIYAAPFA